MTVHRESNPYYSPQDLGLEEIGEIELTEPCYSFDLFVVWRHKETGTYYWATDSGCSCPTPFEDIKTLDDLTSGDRHGALSALDEATIGGTYSGLQAVASLRERIAMGR